MGGGVEYIKKWGGGGRERETFRCKARMLTEPPLFSTNLPWTLTSVTLDLKVDMSVVNGCCLPNRGGTCGVTPLLSPRVCVHGTTVAWSSSPLPSSFLPSFTHHCVGISALSSAARAASSCLRTLKLDTLLSSLLPSSTPHCVEVSVLPSAARSSSSSLLRTLK